MPTKQKTTGVGVAPKRRGRPPGSGKGKGQGKGQGLALAEDAEGQIQPPMPPMVLGVTLDNGRRAYSNEDKLLALSMLEASGGCIAQTAAILQIPTRTLEDWQNGRGIATLGTQERVTKDSLAEKCEAIANLVADSLFDDYHQASPKDRAIILGVMIDKAAVLRGTQAQQGAQNALGITINGSVVNLSGMGPRGIVDTLRGARELPAPAGEDVTEGEIVPDG